MKKSKSEKPEVQADVKVVKEVEIGVLRRAPWNTHAVSRKRDPEFKGMVASVKRTGIIHNIAVRDAGDGTYTIIDGHRRYEAAKEAGVAKVKVDVWEVTETKAKIMTATANIQSADNDPILEAELFEKLTKEGLTTREIAAELGKEERYVARRMRLTALTDSWRELAGTVPVTTECLENVAAHEPELQDEVFEACVGKTPSEEGYGWEDVRHSFESKMMTIAKANFNTCDCVKCPFNTATHVMLFEEMQEADGAKCQNAECYVKKNNVVVDETIRKIKEKGDRVVSVANRYNIPNGWDLKDGRDRKHTQAYVYEQNGMKFLVWGAKPEKKAKDALTDEERAAQKEQKRAEKAKRQAVNCACSRIRAGVESNGDAIDRVIKTAMGRTEFRELVRKVLFEGRYGYLGESECFDLVRAVGDEILANELGIVFEGDERAAVDEELERREKEAEADGGAEE